MSSINEIRLTREWADKCCELGTIKSSTATWRLVHERLISPVVTHFHILATYSLQTMRLTVTSGDAKVMSTRATRLRKLAVSTHVTTLHRWMSSLWNGGIHRGQVDLGVWNRQDTAARACCQ